MPTRRPQVVRKSPRISINKLAEYMTAMAGRRRAIVKKQKEPSEFIVAYYSKAVEVIGKYFEGGRDLAYLETETERLAQAPITSDWDETRKGVCVEAISAFADILEDVEFPQYKKVIAPHDQEKIDIEGVQVSVRPEVLLCSGGKVIGAIKLAIIKTDTIDDRQMDYIGTGLLMYMRQVHNPDIKHSDCYVIDVFGKRLKTSPAAIARRMEDIKAACQELRDTWQRV